MRPKSAWHRARHGWAPVDTWDYDRYLAATTAAALKHLRDTSISYAGPTPEKWAERLTRIIEPLEVWGRHWEWDCKVSNEEAARRYKEAQKAFRRIGEVLGDLWD
jgi:hypothetical protein